MCLGKEEEVYFEGDCNLRREDGLRGKGFEDKFSFGHLGRPEGR